MEMIAVMARYNPFAEHAGMIRVCESKPDKSILEAVAELEKLGFTSYLLAVPEYNKHKLKGQFQQVKEILGMLQLSLQQKNRWSTWTLHKRRL